MSKPMFEEKNLKPSKPNQQKNKTKNNINFKPPPIPEELIHDNILNPDEKSDIEKILNLKKIDSTKCCNLVTKVTECYSKPNENRFLFYLTYGIISFLSEVESVDEKMKYLKPFTTLIKRLDVQIIIFTRSDILYKFYAIIFNELKCSAFVNEFNKVLRYLDVSIRPNKEVFWKKFYNFLNYNTKVKPPKVRPIQFATTYAGVEYLDNVSEKLLFFSLIGLKSFARPKDYAYIYELIFLCIIGYNPKPLDFYQYLIQSDPIGSIDILINYINQNIAPEHNEKHVTKKKNLYDPNFSINIFNIINAIRKCNKYPDEESLFCLAQATIPLISNPTIFKEENEFENFDSEILYLINNFHEETKIRFFYLLLGCSKKLKKDYTNKRVKYDASLCPPIENGILFFRKSGILSSSTVLKFISNLLKEINNIELDRLQLIIESYMEMFSDANENFLSLLSKYQNSQHWAQKYQKTIQDKKKAKAGQKLDKYIENLQKQSPISDKTEIPIPLTIELKDSSESIVTYNLIFVTKKSSDEPKKYTVTFDGSVTVRQAIYRIANIGIKGHDINNNEEEDTNQEPNNINTENSNADNDDNTNENTALEEIDFDDDDDDLFYHTMKLGRDSHFCKDGRLFGHQKTLADRSSREPAEIFGLSNYINRSTLFNSIGFPNNTLYIRLVPMTKLRLDSTYVTKNLKNIVLKQSDTDEEQPKAFADIILPDNDDENAFDLLTSTDMNLIFKLTGHPPTLEEAKQFLKLGKDINKFKESISSKKSKTK